ncbi:hypothetical protein EJB05_49056 [Eragrostis curvula]|uniref:Uncharacterized protein n=1 Tax=Eragrostis curvula TaxID=38414 RepID=A0A5J9T3J1_9POAL|nr:hypothetical protein EJB05_49056 [Eragrostis curvula]
MELLIHYMSDSGPEEKQRPASFRTNNGESFRLLCHPLCRSSARFLCSRNGWGCRACELACKTFN